MADGDSIGQQQMPALARRLQAYAADLQSEPQRQFDLRMASELLEHLARLTTKLARPAEVPLHSGLGAETVEPVHQCAPSAALAR
jgi:hypothetical protein